MTKAIEETLIVWREKSPGVFQEYTIFRNQVCIGDVIYDKKRGFYGRILEMQYKEPGRYSDMDFLVEQIPGFFVFPSVSQN